jgi:hypothetical protein
MQLRVTLAAAAAVAIAASLADAHDDAQQSPGNHAASHIAIKSQGDKRIIEANGLPNHKPGQFPNRGNPNSISEQHYRFEMPLKPQVNDRPRPVRRFLFGIAVNGVVFDPGTIEVWRPGGRIASRPGPETRGAPGQAEPMAWNYEAMGTMDLGVDQNHAHVQPTGAYHYHGLPTGLIEGLRKQRGDKGMLLIGYAADGFPIYNEYGHEKAGDGSSPLKKLRSSYQLKKGDRPEGNDGPGGRYDGTFVQDYEFIQASGDLDECNGRYGVTPDYPAGTYYYAATETYPFIPRFFRGTPDSSFEKMGLPPGQMRRRGRRAPLPRL